MIFRVPYKKDSKPDPITKPTPTYVVYLLTKYLNPTRGSRGDAYLVYVLFYGPIRDSKRKLHA